VRRFHLRGALLGRSDADVAINIVPAQGAFLVLRHAQVVTHAWWIRAEPITG
jgi:hypothetical protein